MVRNVTFIDSSAASCDFQAIRDEVELVSSVYPSARVTLGETPGTDVVALDHVTSWEPCTKVTVTFQVVYGYPHVMPSVSMAFEEPRGATLDSASRVAKAFEHGLRAAAAPSIASGQQCLLQLVAYCESFFSQEVCPQESGERERVVPSSHSRSGLHAEPMPPVPLNAAETPPSSNELLSLGSSTTNKSQLKQLGVLALHLVRKLCNLAHADSPEEGDDIFGVLMQYLSKELNVVPREAVEAWRSGIAVQAAFRQPIDNLSADSKECLKWLWDASDRREIAEARPAVCSRQRFASEFVQQVRIGAGGFAPVYRCRKKVDGRTYAVKKIVIKTRDSAKALREVQTLASLEHENIVRYFDAWLEPGVDPDLKEYAETLEEEDEDCSDDERRSSDVDRRSEEDEDSVDEHPPTTLAALHVTSGGPQTPPAERGGTKHHASASQGPERLLLPPAKGTPKQSYRRSPAEMWMEGSSSSSSPSSSSSSSSRSGCTNGAVTTTESNGNTATTTQWAASRSAATYGRTPPVTPNHPPASPIDGFISSRSSATAAVPKFHTLYIQMELCDAKTLRHLLDSGKFSEPNGEIMAASILRQLLSVVSHVHRECIAHRDLKPDNILFQQMAVPKQPRDSQSGTPSSSTIGGTTRALPSASEASVSGFNFGTIKVVDFGLARTFPNRLVHVRSVDSYGDVAAELPDAGGGLVELCSLPTPPAALYTSDCGTVLYCAPEQAHSNVYDVKVDEYSVGMIALEMWLAVAGKDFRERFSAMNTVTKHFGQLPDWFVQRFPKMATIIASLLCNDPTERGTCESVLLNSELPGEPQEVSAALETISTHASRVAQRVFQKLKEYALSNVRRRKVVNPALLQAFKSAAMDVHRHLELLAVLNGGVVLPFMDAHLPLVSSLVVDCHFSATTLLDEAGRGFIATTFPQLPVASFLVAHRANLDENVFYGSYLRNARPTFYLGTHLTTSSLDLMTQPLLFLLQLLGAMEVAEGSRFHLTFSFVHQRSFSSDSVGASDISSADSSPHAASGRQEVANGQQQPLSSPRLCEVRRADALDEIVHELYPSLSSEETSDFVHAVSTALQVFPYFFKLRSSPRVFVSSVLALHEDAPVDRYYIQEGLVIDVVHTAVSQDNLQHSARWNGGAAEQHHLSSHRRDNNAQALSAASSSTAVGILCNLNAFAETATRNTQLQANLLVLDVAALQSVVKRVTHGLMASAVLDGVVVSRGVDSSTALGANRSAVADAAARLLSAGNRCVVRSRVNAKDTTAFRDVSLASHYGWWLTDNFKLSSIPSIGGKHVRHDVTPDNLAADVRMHMSSKLTAAAASHVVAASSSAHHTWNARVEFVGREESAAVQEAKEALQQLQASLATSTILVVHCSVSEVRQCIAAVFQEQFSDESSTSSTGASGVVSTAATTSPPLPSRLGTNALALLEWLRRFGSSSSMAVFPVYCLLDRRLELVVNHLKTRSSASHIKKYKSKDGKSSRK